MEDVLRGKEAEREGVSEQAAELVCRRDWSSQCCWLLDADAEEKQWGKKISQATVRVNEWFRFFLSFFTSGAHIVVMEGSDPRLPECRLGADDHLAPSIVST